MQREAIMEVGVFELGLLQCILAVVRYLVGTIEALEVGVIAFPKLEDLVLFTTDSRLFALHQLHQKRTFGVDGIDGVVFHVQVNRRLAIARKLGSSYWHEKTLTKLKVNK